MNDDEFAMGLILRLFREIDTPDLREICGEDEWIRNQRDIYNRIRRKLDCEVPLKSLYVNALEDVACKQDGKEKS